MLRNRTLLAAFRQTLEHGRPPTTSRAQTLLPPLPQVQRNVIGRLQQRGISQISRNKATVRPLSTASWQTFVRSPTRLFRRYSDQPTQSLSDKFKELSRKYGWAAVGIYFGLSALDFPFCFLAVRLIGPDRIGEAEHAVVNAFWRLVGKFAPSMRPEHRAVIEGVDVTEAKENVEIDAKAHKENASIWTQLLLAYGLHKSLMIFRIPLTAAVTPKIVKTLRGWGWNIGPRVRKSA